MLFEQSMMFFSLLYIFFLHCFRDVWICVCSFMGEFEQGSSSDPEEQSNRFQARLVVSYLYLIDCPCSLPWCFSKVVGGLTGFHD